MDAVRSIVREMSAHGRGGIVIISHEQEPQIAGSATYKMTLDSSLAPLFRLVGHIRARPDVDLKVRPTAQKTHQSSEPATSAAGIPPFGRLLRDALLTEVERVIEEFGALTAIDGAVLLNRDLALVAFGVILPVGRRPQSSMRWMPRVFMAESSILGVAALAIAQASAMPRGIPVAWCSWRRRTGRSRAWSDLRRQHQARVWYLGPYDVHIS